MVALVTILKVGTVVVAAPWWLAFPLVAVLLLVLLGIIAQIFDA